MLYPQQSIGIGCRMWSYIYEHTPGVPQLFKYAYRHPLQVLVTFLAFSAGFSGRTICDISTKKSMSTDVTRMDPQEMIKTASELLSVATIAQREIWAELAGLNLEQQAEFYKEIVDQLQERIDLALINFAIVGVSIDGIEAWAENAELDLEQKAEMYEEILDTLTLPPEVLSKIPEPEWLQEIIWKDYTPEEILRLNAELGFGGSPERDAYLLRMIDVINGREVKKLKEDEIEIPDEQVAPQPCSFSP